MSAYMCEDDHISALAYLIAEGRSPQMNSVAMLLREENEKSLRHRYRSGVDEMIGDAFEFDNDAAVASAHTHPIAVIQSARCFGYQACEHPQWKESVACMLLDQMVERKIAKLNRDENTTWTTDTVREHPLYERANWGVPKLSK